MTDRSTLRHLEQAGFNAWPSLHTVLDGPWCLRLSGGLTKRANSINTLMDDDETPALCRLRLDRAEALFRRHGLAPVFRTTPLTGAATLSELDRRGWTLRDPSLVMHGPLPIPARPPEPDALSDHPGQDWLDLFCRIDSLAPGQRCLLKRMLRGIALPHAYACIRQDGQPVAVALAVADGPLLGLFCVGTAPEARQQGLGKRCLSSLLHWGTAQGASRLWLQVSAANTPARTLYERMGLGEVYPYEYRVAPLSADQGAVPG